MCKGKSTFLTFFELQCSNYYCYNQYKLIKYHPWNSERDHDTFSTNIWTPNLHLYEGAASLRSACLWLLWKLCRHKAFRTMCVLVYGIYTPQRGILLYKAQPKPVWLSQSGKDPNKPVLKMCSPKEFLKSPKAFQDGSVPYSHRAHQELSAQCNP